MAHAWLSHIAAILTTAGVGVLLFAAMHDLVARTVPNWVALALAGVGLPLRAIDGTILYGLAAGLIVFAVAFLLWRRGWMGGADVKLLGAAAIALPPFTIPSFIAAMSIAGALHAIAYLAARPFVPLSVGARPRGLMARAWRAECRRIRRGDPLPYVCAIAAGFLFVIL